MIYLVAPAGFTALIALWAIVTARRRYSKNSMKQERLSSAFNRSRAVRAHGPGAQGISQNIRIAGLVASTAKSGQELR
jgi:hypothetical protein